MESHASISKVDGSRDGVDGDVGGPELCTEVVPAGSNLACNLARTVQVAVGLVAVTLTSADDREDQEQHAIEGLPFDRQGAIVYEWLERSDCFRCGVLRLPQVLDAKKRMREAKGSGDHLQRLPGPGRSGDRSVRGNPRSGTLILPRKNCRRDLVDLRQQLVGPGIGVVVACKSGHWREGNLVWGPPKGGERTVPVPLHLVEALDELIAGRPRSALVIESEREKVLRVRTFRRKVDWTKLVADLGFDGFRIHDLRATAVTNLLAAGVPPHVVRDIVGHKDLQVTSLYARAHDDALSLAAAALMAYQERA